MLRILAVIVLPLLLLPMMQIQTNAAESPFHGKWSAETMIAPNKTAKFASEFKADGTMEMSYDVTDAGTGKIKGKWKATGEKTMEFTLDVPPPKPSKGVLLDKDTLEVTDYSDKKVKFTRVK